MHVLPGRWVAGAAAPAQPERAEVVVDAVQNGGDEDG